MGSVSTLPKRGRAEAAPRRDLMTSAEVAKFLHLAPRTLNNWRCKGEGPAYVKVGDAVRYEPEAVDAWLEARKVSA